jgi:hypothetical protein
MMLGFNSFSEISEQLVKVKIASGIRENK